MSKVVLFINYIFNYFLNLCSLVEALVYPFILLIWALVLTNKSHCQIGLMILFFLLTHLSDRNKLKIDLLDGALDGNS